MAQTIKTNCEQCGASLKIKPELVGKRVKCPSCEQPTYLIEPGRETSAESPQGKQDTLANSAGETSIDQSAPKPTSPAPTQIGKLGRFEIRELLGAGAFGRVYKAYDPQLERFVALKIPSFMTSDQHRLKRFVAEAKHAARLTHPNIVQVFESGQIGGKYYIATQYVDGETLAAWIKTEPVSVRQAVEWLGQLADAVGYAHQQGIIHRDLKPENVMLDANLRPLIMDFGLAKRIDDDANMTRDGSLLGTPAYMSPEQARGEVDKLGPASDQYSLGVMLYRLLAGTTPFEGPSHVVIANVAISAAPSLAECGKFIPEGLTAICDKVLKHNPSDRYLDCAALKSDLNNWLAGRPLSVGPQVSETQNRNRGGWYRNRIAQLAMGFGGVVFLATIIIFFKGNRIEIADNASVSVKIDSEKVIIEPLIPAEVAEAKNQVEPPLPDSISLAAPTVEPTAQSPSTPQRPARPEFAEVRQLTDSPHIQALFGVSDEYEWSPVELMSPAINSDAQEQTCALSSDGLSLYFVSSRGRSTSLDLWVSKREHIDSPWLSPTLLPAPINGSGTEWSPFVSPDESEIYFHRPGWIMSSSRGPDGTWSEPIQIAPGQCPYLSPDGKTLYFVTMDNDPATGKHAGKMGRCSRASRASPWSSPGDAFPELGKLGSLCWMSDDGHQFLLIQETGVREINFVFLDESSIEPKVFRLTHADLKTMGLKTDIAIAHLSSQSSELIQEYYSNLFISTLRHKKTGEKYVWPEQKAPKYGMVPRGIDQAEWERLKNVAPPMGRASMTTHETQQLQQRWADHLQIPVHWKNSLGIEFRLIPPGQYMLGMTPEDSQQVLSIYSTDEIRESRRQMVIGSQPPQLTTVDRPFYMSVYELTQVQYATVVGQSPAYYSPTGDGKGELYKFSSPAGPNLPDVDIAVLPVESVSCYDAINFCNQLSKLESLNAAYTRDTASADLRTQVGQGYRLPLESEWEWACRGDGDLELPFVSESLSRFAWSIKDGQVPRSVGQLAANALGLCDMQGNVTEWCQDHYQPLTGPELDTLDRRVVRGGTTWNENINELSAGFRCWGAAAYRWPSGGFRVLKPVVVEPPILELNLNASPLSQTTIGTAYALDSQIIDTLDNSSSNSTDSTPRPPDVQKSPKVDPQSPHEMRLDQREPRFAEQLGIELVKIPAGTFEMGNRLTANEVAEIVASAPRSIDNESPVHRVIISRPFLMASTEITFAQFRRFTEDTNFRTVAEVRGKGAGFHPETGTFSIDAKFSWRFPGFSQGDSHPVVNITWFDAQQFCSWLTEKDGRRFTLPTEAQWEYACRAGTNSAFNWGDSIADLPNIACFSVVPGDRTGSKNRSGVKRYMRESTQPVKSFTPNAFGLYDMHGNAWEWCEDLYASNYYEVSSDTNPPGPKETTEKTRCHITRGGGWYYGPHYCRSSCRYWFQPDNANCSQGFRVVSDNVDKSN